MLGASSALFAQNLSSVPDVRQIVESSTAATQRHWQERLHYTYVAREESRRRGPAREVGGRECIENDSSQGRSVRAFGAITPLVST
jgi:hypothetical protein